MQVPKYVSFLIQKSNPLKRKFYLEMDIVIFFTE